MTRLAPYPKDLRVGGRQVKEIRYGRELIWTKPLSVRSAFRGSGGLSAVTSVVPVRSGVFSGDGELTATASPAFARPLGLSGTGGLAATVSPVSAISAVLSGAGGLTATVMKKAPVAANLSGGGTLSVTTEKVFVSPPDISGLGAWLDANQLALADGASVTSWSDTSGAGRNAVSMDTNKPVYTATGFNGLPAVDFSATLQRLKMLGLGTALSGKTEYTLFLTMKPRSYANYDTVMSAPVGANYKWFIEFDTSGYLYWAHVAGGYDYAYLVSTLALGVPRVLTFSHNNGIAANSRAYQDGAQMAVVPDDGAGISAVVPDVSPDVIVGGYYTSAYWFNGQIAEIIWYDHALTDAERLKVEGYLRKKWFSPKPKFSGGGTLSATAVSGTVSDDFNRADAPDLGPGWVNHNGTMSIVGGMAKPNGLTTWNYASSTTLMTSNDAEVSITLGPYFAPHDHVLIYVGANDTGELIFAYFYDQVAYFWHQSAWASYSNISTQAMAYTQGDTLTLRRIGTVYTIFKNGVDTGYNTNTTLVPISASRRQVGFGLYTDNGTGYRMVDAFSARSL